MCLHDSRGGFLCGLGPRWIQARGVCVAFLVAALAALTAKGQEAGPLAIEDAIGTRSFKVPRLAISPDGKRVSFAVTEDARINKETPIQNPNAAPSVNLVSSTYVLNLATGEERDLGHSDVQAPTPAWSPNGRYLIFVSGRADQSKLCLWDAVENELRTLRDKGVKGFQLEWTPDGQKVIFAVPSRSVSEDKDTAPDVSIRKVVGGQERSASTDSITVFHSPILSARDKPSQGSDPWSLDRRLCDLVGVDVHSGKAVPIVERERIAKYLVSPDGSRIAYTIPRRFERPGSQQILFDLLVVSLPTGESRIVASNIRLNYDGAEFSWSPSGQQLSFRTGGMEETASDCYAVDLNGGSPRKISALPDWQAGSFYTSDPPIWDANGRFVYFVYEGALWRASPGDAKAAEVGRVPDRRITRVLHRPENLVWTPQQSDSAIVLTRDDGKKQDGFYAIDLNTGGTKRLLENGQCYTCNNRSDSEVVSGDGEHIAYFAEDTQHDRDLWEADSDFQSRRQLTHLHPQLQRYRMGAARLVDWLSVDGEQLHGALLLPPDYREGKRYPLIVFCYGGISLSDSLNRFGFEGPGPMNLQLLATRGYAVLLPDAPQHLGTPMSDLPKAILPGVNRLVELGIADGGRLGIMGHSYGGYSTLSMIAQTKRFKAAIEVDGYADILGAYGAMAEDGSSFGVDVQEHGLGSMGGTPWQFRDRYIENSPILYLDRVETPLLIVEGTRDSTVPMFLADEMFVALRRLGKEAEYQRYDGEGHDPNYWSHDHQTAFCEQMIRWFDVHLKASSR